METVSLKVNGMTCSNCARGISHYLEKKGLEHVNVSFATGDVSFDADKEITLSSVIEGIRQLGYEVVTPESATSLPSFWQSTRSKFFLCLAFTLPLMLHMVVSWHWLHNPWLQLILCLPVYITGCLHFGRSAIRSLKNGVPNMDVLIIMGATAAFVYSLLGTILQLGSGYLFYETAASIITLVLLGNLLEERSIRQTTTAISELARMQVATARLIETNTTGGQEIIKEVDNRILQVGDRVLVNMGDKIPVDGEIYWGGGGIDESMVTGESEPVEKSLHDRVIGGTILQKGSLKMRVTATGKDTVLSYIIDLVRQAQHDKPPMQRLADRISAVFVPVVIGIALLTFALSWWGFSIPFQQSMMRAIAVLVIACPCAMGLATPAAVMVGLGRAARHGILIKGGHTLESFRHIRQVVFDKTGTLTTGQMKIAAWNHPGMEANVFKSVVATLERHSVHPVAKAVTQAWKEAGEWPFQSVEELKGLGMRGVDAQGDQYEIGSFRLYHAMSSGEPRHSLYLLKNGHLSGWIDLEDELRTDAAGVIAELKKHGIRTILLSGDQAAKCEIVAQSLGIDEVYAEQTPPQKLERIGALSRQGSTAMVGDGINDAPALAKADIGISLSDATEVAMQSANVILLNGELKNLPLALGLGKHTYLTIRQNLFWAFFYNVVAIPFAALGFLSPIIGAAVMGLSDVVLALNSIRLKYKKLSF